MNLDQLRFLCEVVDQGFSISRAAEVMHIAQPWVSKNIAALEQELGLALLVRSRGRVVGLTKPGETVVHIARRITSETSAIARVGQEYTGRGLRVVIATTHLNARYVLPPVIKRFRRAFPKVQLGLLQATTEQTTNLVLSGKADLAVGPEQTDLPKEVMQLTCFPLPRCVIVPPRHALLKQGTITLEDIARYPLISYESSHIGAIVLNRTFMRHGIRPDVVINATDTEVVKEYVKLGLGIAVVPKVAIDKTRDRGLRTIEAGHLFEATNFAIMFRPDPSIGAHVCDFAGMIDPKWTAEKIRSLLACSAGQRAAT